MRHDQQGYSFVILKVYTCIGCFISRKNLPEWFAGISHTTGNLLHQLRIKNLRCRGRYLSRPGVNLNIKIRLNLRRGDGQSGIHKSRFRISRDVRQRAQKQIIYWHDRHHKRTEPLIGQQGNTLP